MRSLAFDVHQRAENGASFLELIVALLLFAVLIGEPLSLAIRERRMLAFWKHEQFALEQVLTMRQLIASGASTEQYLGGEPIRARCDGENENPRYCHIESSLPTNHPSVRIMQWH